ncbi:WSC domain-containing protein [Dactylonectria macrodidyma]|uniref:WSC domain-containing protein n=1 Tax=Dactylonectria macrodidyma TaxID=307937 RepID=A0A9P9ER33_9HYPO|nr:WSC domain-containing protein [Dactylonectria macrodidyma]
MKTPLFSLLVLSIGTRFGAATSTPQWQWDPETIDSCIEWYNHEAGNEPCEYVRDYFNISPEDFTKWNPSVGLDCKPWRFNQSYCIVTKERLASVTKTRTTQTPSTTTTFTSSTSTLGPSPTAWSALGCYVDNTTTPILEERISKEGGDASLTIPECQDACYLAQFRFVGVKGGNECWCSSYVAGEWTRNQTDCNMPCTGNATENCGGKGLVNVFEPDMEDEDWLEDENTVVDENGVVNAQPSTSEVVNAQTSTSGATRLKFLS